jgi:hypothetical protein
MHFVILPLDTQQQTRTNRQSQFSKLHIRNSIILNACSVEKFRQWRERRSAEIPNLMTET